MFEGSTFIVGFGFLVLLICFPCIYYQVRIRDVPPYLVPISVISSSFLLLLALLLLLLYVPTEVGKLSELRRQDDQTVWQSSFPWSVLCRKYICIYVFIKCQVGPNMNNIHCDLSYLFFVALHEDMMCEHVCALYDREVMASSSYPKKTREKKRKKGRREEREKRGKEGERERGSTPYANSIHIYLYIPIHGKTSAQNVGMVRSTRDYGYVEAVLATILRSMQHVMTQNDATGHK
jgi:hypothetical protein